MVDEVVKNIISVLVGAILGGSVASLASNKLFGKDIIREVTDAKLTLAAHTTTVNVLQAEVKNIREEHHERVDGMFREVVGLGKTLAELLADERKRSQEMFMALVSFAKDHGKD